MKNLCKKSISLLLAFIIIFSSVGTGVTEFSASAANDTVYSYSGISFTLNEAEEATIVSYTKSSENVDIPETVRKNALLTKKYKVTAIGDHAIPHDAVNVTIPSTVTSIGKDNFRQNTILRSVTFVDSPITSIDDFMFENCHTLNSITLPENLEHIGTHAFGRCFAAPGKLELPPTVKTIGTAAFEGCHQLTEINLPEGLTQIGESAFSDCNSLSEISIPSTVTDIGEAAFFNCTGLERISLPEINNLKNIYAGSFNETAFYRNEANWDIDEFYGTRELYLNNILLTVTNNFYFIETYEIKPQTEKVATNFAQITPKRFSVAQGNTSFSADVYGVLYNYEKTELIRYPIGSENENYHIDSKVTSIKPHAFNGGGLRNITVSNISNLQEIGDFAFANCSNLEFIHIPSSVKKIGEGIITSTDNTFICSESETSLANTYATENNLVFQICNGHSSEYVYNDLCYEIINGNVYIIGCKETFEGELFIPDTIDGYPVISIESLSDSQTGGCSQSIYSVYIPETVSNISEGAFFPSMYINRVVVDNKNPYYISDEDGVLFNKDKTVLVYCPNLANISVYYIPETVERIAAGAFYSQKNLGTVYIPSSVETIGQNSFSFCNNLCTASFEIGSLLTKIEASAFCGSTIQTINLPENLSIIESDVFMDCTSLHDIFIPARVESIGENVFYGCDFLETITVDKFNSFYSSYVGVLFNKEQTVLIKYPPKIANRYPEEKFFIVPYGVETIVDSAFDNCQALLYIEFPDTLQTIGSAAFSDCIRLEDIIIPDSVTDIGNDAFLYCNQLKSIKLSENLKTLSPGTFSNCTSLKSISLPAGIEEVDATAFIDTFVLEYIHVPSNSEEFRIVNAEGIVSPWTYVCSESVGSYAEVFAKELGLEFRVCSGHGNTVYVENVVRQQEKYYSESYAFYLVKTVGCPQKISFISQETGETWTVDRDSDWIYYEPTQQGVAGLTTYNDLGQEVDTDYDGFVYEDWLICLSLPEGTYNVITSKIGFPEAWEPVEGSYEYTVAYSESPSIMFDANGGYFSLDEVYTQYGLNLAEGDEITYPDAPYREGYVFAYWTLDGERFNEVVFDGVSKTLEAAWIEESTEKYTVLTYIMNTQGEYELFSSELFEASDGETVTYTPTPVEGFSVNEEKSILSGVFVEGKSLVLEVYIDRDVFTLYYVECEYPPVKYLAGSIVAEPRTPYRTGHRFLGWADGYGNWVEFPFLMPTNDVTLYAVWEPEEFKLTFDAGEGFFPDGTNIKEFYVPFGNAIKLPENPTREGYEFFGWDEPVPAKMPDKSLYFKAVWSAETYKITFHANGGYFENKQIEITQYYHFGDKIIPPEVKIEDSMDVYFDYWLDDLGNMFTDEYYMPARNVEAIAIWEPYTYDIVFDAYDGAFEDGDVQKRYDLVYGEAVPDPGVPKRLGYSFDGWSPTPPSVMEKESVYCEARWKPETYTVTFNANTGTFSEGLNTFSYYVFYGDLIPFPENPTKEGYSFTGWDTTYTVMPAKNIVIDAKWEVNHYTVEWITDEHEIRKDTYEFGESINVPQAKEKTGYTFAFWSENPNGEQTDIPEKMSAKNLRYYAVYELNTYKLTYYAGKGFFSDGTNKKVFEYKYGSETEEFTEKPYSEGYTFDGWDIETPVNMPAEDVDIYAVWAANQYTVTWVLETDEAGEIKKYEIEEYYYGETIDPYPAVKAGHQLKMWVDEEKNPAPETMPAFNLVLYPEWEPIKYTVKYYLSENDIAEGEIFYEVQLNMGDLIPIPDDGNTPQMTGYWFVSWLCVTPNKENIGIGSPMPDLNLEFVAVWKQISYSVDWCVKAEGVVLAIYHDNYYYGQKIIPPVINKEGFTYSPWYPEVPEYMPAHDLKFYTDETRNDYTVTFNANGGSFGDGSTSVSWQLPFESEIIQPKNPPTRIGYTFEGWTPEVPKYIPAQNIELLAIWKPNTINVVFNANGGVFVGYLEGTLINDKEDIIVVPVEYDEKIVPPVSPVKEHFSFGGWEPNVPDKMTSTETLTFSATWVDCYYTVEIYEMDTTGEYTLRTERCPATPGENVDISERLNSLDKDSGLYGNAGKSVCKGIVKADNSLVLKLYFGRNKYKLTFDAAEGTFVDGTEVKTDFYYHGSIMPNFVPQRTGYIFVKWTPEITQTILKEETYIAEWKRITYSITWDFADERESQIDYYQFGQEIPEENIPWHSLPSNESYYYVWFEPNLQIEVPSHMPEYDLVFHELPVTKTCEVTFDAGEGIFSDNTTVQKVSGYYGTEIPVPENPVREGYSFLGWQNGLTGESCEPGQPVGFFGTNTDWFKAIWEINSYTVTFHANGGIFSDGKVSVVYVVEYNTPIPSPDQPYYAHQIHENWRCITEGYENLRVGDPMPACDLEFISVWFSKMYKVEFDANGGIFPDGSTTQNFHVPYGEKIPLPDNPSREGYLFSGWEPEVGIMDDAFEKIFYAQWVPVPEPEEASYSIEIYTMDTEGNYSLGTKTTSIGRVGEYISITPNTPKGFSLGEGNVLSGIIEADGSLVLKVYYERNKYVLHAVLDGVEISGKEYYYEASAEEPEAPIQPGYHFRGWIDAQGEYVQFPFPMPAEDVYVYAYSHSHEYDQWYPVLIHITWMNDGEIFDNTVAHFGERITEPPSIPYKTGYAFDKWICTTDSSIEVGSSAPYYDLEFNAEFNPNPVTVIFYDGTEEVSRVETECNAPISPPENREKEGYALVWKNSDENELPSTVPCIDFAEGETEIILEYYADYTAKSYNVRWVDGNTVRTEKYDYNSVIKEYKIEKTGYSLTWKDSKGNVVTFTDTSPKMSAEDITYRAEWTANTYNAVFDANGGTFSTCPEGAIINETQNIITVPTDYNKKIIAPPNPERAGYVFHGWNPSVGKMDVAADKNFTAQWTKLYKLEINYITLNGEVVAPQYSQMYEEGSDYFEFNPTVTGYTCDSAYVEGTITEDTVINIYYIANVHKISFFIKTPDELLNGELHSYTYSYADKIEMSIFPPSYNGYAFSGFEDENGNEIEIPETMPDNDIFVYVCYYAKEYTLQIDYVYSDGTKAAESFVDTVAFGEYYSQQSPEVTGYKPNFIYVTGTMPSKSVKRRVTYTVNGYNVYIKYNDETVETLAFDYGEEIILDFDIPDIEGYTYSGTSNYPKTMPAHDVTVNLEYTKNKYKVDINYQYPDKTQAAAPVSVEVPYGEEYNFDSPTIEGFIPDIEKVSGKMGAENISVTVTYKKAVSIVYDANGALGTPPIQTDVAKGEEITVQGPGDLYKIYSENIDISARLPLDVVLLLDSSGSMMESDPSDIRLRAAREYAETLTDVDRAAVIDFDDSVNVLCNFTNSKQEISSSISRIDSNGGTMISNGISSAIRLFENAENPAGITDKIIILLTDGQSSYDTSVSLLARNNGITVFTIGLGNGVEEKLLREIAETTGGQYFWIDDASDLPALFEVISKKTVTIRYEFAGWLASDESGELGVYEEGDKLEVNSNTLLVAIWIEPDEMYVAEWAFGSKCRKQIYYANEKPVYNGPDSIVEGGNVLTLLGWDTNGDGLSDFGPFDEMPPITKRTTYYAVYRTEKKKITEIKLSANSLTLFTGQTATLLKEIVPESADKNDITWKSTDPSIASVDKSGIVTAKVPGSVIIRAENIDGTVTATCRVTVIEPRITSITINTMPKKLEYFVGDNLDTTGLTLKIVYSNDETVIIEEGFTCSPTILNVAGKRRITVDYKGANCYFDVSVFKCSYAVIYTVDGTEYTKYTVVEGDTVPVPSVPIKVGHTFDGWCDGSGKIVNIPDKMPGKNLSFSAKWSVNKYTAKWYSEESLFNEEEYSYGEKILFNSVPEKEGHSFIGWVPEVPETMPVGNQTFHANFKANTYKADFLANGGAFADSSEKITVETDYGASVAAPDAPEKQGYVFAGWDNSVPETMPAEDLTFTASWISADDTVYNVEMYYMDTMGQYSKIPDSIVGCKGTTDETVTAKYTVPEGFTVDEAISVLSGTVAADGSLVLKVYFKRNLYSLTTVVDGKSETTEYLFGSLLAAPATPVKEGYSFVKWQNEDGSTFDFSAITYMTAYDIKVTAIFEINKYTVTYIVEGRECAFYEVEVGAEIPVPQNPIFFLTKVFVKWEPEVLSVMPAKNLVYNAVIHTHTYEKTVTREPTCTEKGEITEKCSCGKTKKRSTDALGHNWSVWQILRDATQYENGITVRTCSRCGAYDYEDLPARNANFTVRPIEDQTFNSFISSKPSVEVYSLDGKKLNQLFHYRKEYKNNDQVGTASVFVTGRGDYYGQVRVDFNIVERKADSFVITFPTVIYSDTVEEIDPIVKYEEIVLIKNEDYTVEYVTDENGDVTSAIISGIGNYEGEQTVEIETVEKQVSFTVTEIPDQEYTGYEITPEFNVYDGEKVLRENTDYTVEYYDNINVGFGRIVVKGTGDYSDSVTLPFRINGMDASELDIPILLDAVYSEEGYYPDFDFYPITHNGKELVEDVDYEYYVENADSVGTAEIVIIGKGNYSGKTVIYVNIVSPAISSAEIVLPSDTLGYYKTMTLTVNTFPDYTSAKNIIWSTSNKRIAKIDENGIVKAVGRGNVTITATVTDEYGNSISTSVEITCTMTFWQSIVAFFRRLFGID
ncbi:MAG: InlB B-repeat-containing protein [Clostridia bacterium]|nr:InlB B-repeat-containing protein [Clostridia bacterium]